MNIGGHDMTSIKRNDILHVYSVVKFLYRDCDVTMTRLNNMVDIGIVKIHKEGYIIEKHRDKLIKSNYEHLLNFLNEQNTLLEKTHKKVLMREGHIDRLLEPPQIKEKNPL